MTTILTVPTIFGIEFEVYFIIIILGAPVYLLSRWIFKKRIQSIVKRRIVTWMVTIIATPVIYIAIVLLFLVCFEYYPNKDFNRKQWLTDTSKRYEFANDIVKSNMLIGKTKAGVEETLGGENNTLQSDDWYYDLGFRPELLNIDPDNLEIVFKNGQVISVKWNKR